MSAASYGAESGAVLGIAFVLLAQQFGYLALDPLVAALEYLVIAAIIGGILFGLLGWMLGRRYLRNHPEIPTANP
jgi:ABC-type Fe3+-siderophore transport system permease subunit